MTLVDIIQEWEGIVGDLGEVDGEFAVFETGTCVKREEKTVAINHSSFLLKKYGEDYFAALAEDIPQGEIDSEISKLREKWEKYAIDWDEKHINIRTSGSEEEMSSEIIALRKRYGKPFSETYV